MAEQAISILEREAAARAHNRLIELAREALPPELAHLAEGPMAEALVKAVDYARASVSPTTEKIYQDASRIDVAAGSQGHEPDRRTRPCQSQDQSPHG